MLQVMVKHRPWTVIELAQHWQDSYHGGSSATRQIKKVTRVMGALLRVLALSAVNPTVQRPFNPTNTQNKKPDLLPSPSGEA
jgi:hypothetical protein